MNEKDFAELMKNNPELEIDTRVTASKRCERCSFTNGAHDASCPTNNEYDYYCCRRCGDPEIQYAMFEGLCSLCQDTTGIHPAYDVNERAGRLFAQFNQPEIFVSRDEVAGKVTIRPGITAVGDITKADLDFKSKTEREAWYEWLPTIEHVRAEYEPMILRVAGANYTPDIVLLRPDGRIWFIEVKGAGGWKAYKSGRSSKRSLKQCSRYYAWLGDFYLLMKIPKKDGGGWHFEQY